MQLLNKNLSAWSTLWLAVTAILSFHVAYTIRNCQILMIVFLCCLFCLANLQTSRRAFYVGLAIGLAIYAPQLSFFWTIFQGGAIALWVILSCWIGLFLVLGRACLLKFGPKGWACAAPFVWTGLEYFRSELYYLKFSWMNAGYAFSDSGGLLYFGCYGVYGIGFVLMTLAVFLTVFRQLAWFWRIMVGIVVIIFLSYPAWALADRWIARPPRFRVTGVQLEFPSLC